MAGASVQKPGSKHHGTIPSWALRPTVVPLALLRAIFKAAKKYNVPPDVLAGIWREESGSTYPNPAQNSSGYGGLFGTTDSYGTTQAQADLSASILHAGLVQSHGNIAEALSYYNSGKLSGGYTHVPGQVTTGVIPGYGGKPTKQKGGGGGGGLGSDLASAGSTALSFVTNPIGSLFGATGIPQAITNVGKIIMYAGSIFGGGIIFILGLILIAADVGLSTRAGKIAAAIPAGRVIAGAAKAKGVTTATKTPEPKSNIPDRAEQRKEEAHQANLKKIKAQTAATKARKKATTAQAKRRKKTVKEQKASEQKSYYAGARDAASPTMARIRRDRKQKRK